MEDFLFNVVAPLIKKAILFGFIGFVGGVIIVGILHASGLLKREGSLLNVLVKLYYLYIPIGLAATLVAYSFSYYGQEVFDKMADKSLTDFKEKLFPPFHEYLKENADEFSKEPVTSGDTIVNRFLFSDSTQSFDDEVELNPWLLGMILNDAIIKKRNKIDPSKDELYTVKEALARGRFKKSAVETPKKIRRMADEFIAYYNRQLFLGFLVWMAVPALEFFVEIRTRRRRRRQGPPEIPPTPPSM